jgi:hypothetical protein
MAKRKKPTKKVPPGETITILVPKEWASYDEKIIQGIIEATLGKGPKFGISKVIVRSAGEAPGEVHPMVGWDKFC